jgi:hypothetical protein
MKQLDIQYFSKICQKNSGFVQSFSSVYVLIHHIEEGAGNGFLSLSRQGYM